MAGPEPLLEGAYTNKSLGLLGPNPKFSYRFWRETNDFYVDFETIHLIFIWILEADLNPTGVTAPESMYIGSASLI